MRIEDIKGRSALEKLKKYNGTNPYIKKLKLDFENKRINLTATQSKYIEDHYQMDPILINRVIGITDYLGSELQKNESLSFKPERILVEYMLGETEKSYHVYGKLKKNQKKSGMYFIPKSQVNDDPYFEHVDIEVDFEKYKKLDTFVLKDGTIGRTPYEHQKEGIKFLLGRDGCILADDMGLGKTYQAIIAALEKGAERILIVCPSSVKINWEREIRFFQCHDTSIIDGKKWNPARFTIINYDILKNFHEVPDTKIKEEDICWENQHLVQGQFDLCIIDEAHYLKDHTSLRGSIMKDLCVKHGIDIVWLLTGTPVANRPKDFYNLLALIKAPIADNWMFYVKRYCEARMFNKKLKNGKTKQIWLTNGASNLEELSRKVRNLFLRRMKTEIDDMPDKIVTPIYHDMTKEELRGYDGLWDEYLTERKRLKKRGDVDKDLVELILLRQYIAKITIPKTIEMVENALEQDQKVIIFTNFTEELQTLHDHFGNESVIHYGEMTDKQKQVSVDAFQNNPNKRIFIGNIKSAGVGITLTEGTIVIFNSFDWVTGNNEQAEDRSYRIGQTNHVNVYYQLFNDSIATRMWEVLRNKKEVIDRIIGQQIDLDDEESIELIMEHLISEL
jgi:SWI/SNF-related matrix-associated actin-dependent regulator 1 of chromatin subfamily A